MSCCMLILVGDEFGDMQTDLQPPTTHQTANRFAATVTLISHGGVAQLHLREYLLIKEEDVDFHVFLYQVE